MRQIENTIPVLPVANLQASFGFYEQVAGFKRNWSGATVGSVSRDGHAIMLQQNGGTGRSKVWIGCEDVLALHEEMTARGAKVVHPPTNEGHALEMRIEDLDGNVLWFGSEPLKNVPFGQPVPLKR